MLCTQNRPTCVAGVLDSMKKQMFVLCSVQLKLYCYFVVYLSKLASNGSVIGEFESIWKESRCLIEVLSLHLPGRTKEKHEEPQVK